MRAWPVMTDGACAYLRCNSAHTCSTVTDERATKCPLAAASAISARSARAFLLRWVPATGLASFPRRWAESGVHRDLVPDKASAGSPVGIEKLPDLWRQLAASEELEQAPRLEARWVERAAEARVRRDLLAQQITDEESTATLRRRSQIAHRREAGANIAAQVMAGTAHAVLTETHRPLGHRNHPPVETRIRQPRRVAAAT